MTFSRRSLLYLAFLLIVSLLLFRWRTTLKSLLFRPEARGPRRPRSANPFLEQEKALVSLVHGGDVEAMVREAVELIGGMEKIGVKGKTVLVKPNVVSGEPSPATTSPKVISAVVKLLKEAGAQKIYVGDMSALLALPTRANLERTGILQATQEAGAEALCFEDYGWVRVDLPKGRYVREAYVSEWIYKVDRVINLPVVKTHRNAVYTICLKNFIGATHGRQRPYLIDAGHWEEIIAELNLAYEPHLNLIDGTKVMASGGPWSGEVEEAGVVLASGDRIAADVIGLGLIKHYNRWQDVADKGVWEQRQIRRAVELGLGVKDAASVRLKAKSFKAPDPNFDQLLSAIQKHALSPA